MQIALRKIGVFAVMVLAMSFGRVVGRGAYEVVTGRPAHHIYAVPPAPIAGIAPPSPISDSAEGLLLGHDNAADAHVVHLDDSQTLLVRRMVIKSLSDHEVAFGKNMLAVRGLEGSRRSIDVCGTILERAQHRVFMVHVEDGYDPEVWYDAQTEQLCLEAMFQTGIDPNG